MNSYLLHNEKKGDGPTVVLLPGMLGTTKFWSPLVSLLQTRFQTVSIDLLGFGRSKAPFSQPYTLKQHVQSIKKTIDNEKISPKIIVGHSMGALIALAFTANYPGKVEKLILVSPPVFETKEEAKENIIRFSPLPGFLLYGPLAQITCLSFCLWLRPITRLFIPFFLCSLPKEVARDTLLHTWWSYKKTLQNVIEEQDVCSLLRQIKKPVTIVYGANDNRVVKENIQHLISCKKDILIRVVKGVSHNLPLKKPESIAGLLV